MAEKSISWRGHRRKLIGKESEVIKTYQSGLSLKQVGNLFDVPFGTIYSILSEFSIQRRSISESTKLICTPERNQKVSDALKGKPTWNKGKTFKHKRRHFRPSIQGENNPNWKGGTTSSYSLARNSPEYKAWRTAVFIRDNRTCVFCKRPQKKGQVEIQADHIKPFSQYPELRYDITNGRTLCVDCHKQTPTYGVKSIYQRF